MVLLGSGPHIFRIFILLLISFGSNTLFAQDGGRWEIVFGEGESYSFTDVDCFDSLHCLIVGNALNEGVFWTTSDGGKTWREAFRDTTYVEKKYPQYTTVTYFNADEAIVSVGRGSGGISGGYVMKSIDQGRSWATTQIHYQGGFHPFSMYDMVHGGGITRPRTFWTTYDGWQTWDSVELTSPSGWTGGVVSQLRCLGPGRYLCCWSGPSEFPNVFALSVDTGRTWEFYPLTAESSQIDVEIRELSFIDSLHGWGVGTRRLQGVRFQAYIFRTTDGGRSWETQFDGIVADSAYLWDVEFKDDLNGLIAADQVVLRTDDGGRTWQEEEYEDSTRRELPRKAVDYTLGSSGLVITTLNPVVYQYVSTLSVEEEQGSDGEGFRVIPNPVSDRLQIVFDLQRSHSGALRSVRVYDVLGRDVLGESFRIEPSGRLDIDVSRLSTGSYHVVIEDKEGRHVARRSAMILR